MTVPPNPSSCRSNRRIWRARASARSSARRSASSAMSGAITVSACRPAMRSSRGPSDCACERSSPSTRATIHPPAGAAIAVTPLSARSPAWQVSQVSQVSPLSPQSAPWPLWARSPVSPVSRLSRLSRLLWLSPLSPRSAELASCRSSRKSLRRSSGSASRASTIVLACSTLMSPASNRSRVAGWRRSARASRTVEAAGPPEIRQRQRSHATVDVAPASRGRPRSSSSPSRPSLRPATRCSSTCSAAQSASRCASDRDQAGWAARRVNASETVDSSPVSTNPH